LINGVNSRNAGTAFAASPVKANVQHPHQGSATDILYPLPEGAAAESLQGGPVASCFDLYEARHSKMRRPCSSTTNTTFDLQKFPALLNSAARHLA
jgi:hypothetical protein